MKNSFSLRHIGINTPDAQEAEQLANLLSAMFNLEPKMGNKSVFAGSLVECMKSPYLGKNGHIALETPDLESAVEHMTGVSRRFEPNPTYTDLYDRKYRLYCRTIDCLDGLWSEMQAMIEEEA